MRQKYPRNWAGARQRQQAHAADRANRLQGTDLIRGKGLVGR